MKTRMFYFVLAVAASIVAVTSCGGQKQVTNNGKKEIVQPFNTPDYRSDNEYFRATASGTSPDMEAARTIADMNARQQLAAQVTSVIKSVTEKYMKQLNVANKTEFAQKMEQNVRMVINQELSGAVIKDTKLYQNEDGSYEYWYNVEMPKVKIEETIEELINKDEEMALDFNQHLFRKVFDEEMALEMQKQAQGR